MASRTKRLYVGVTNSLERRVCEHKRGDVGGFTTRYNIVNLVHSEGYSSVFDAINREKQIKGWLRARKIALIEDANREWDDLADGWCTQ